jgi:predicted amidohydrolase
MMERDTRIAAVVCRCPVGQTKRNLERIRYWVEQARKKGAAFVCFPELNITGYSNREEIAGHAISAHGSEINTLVRLAVDQQVVLLVGFAEKNGEGNDLCQPYGDHPSGSNGHLPETPPGAAGNGSIQPGNALPVFHWSGIRFGIQLCYDAHFPELSTRMAETDADMIFMPHASPRGQAADKHLSWMRHLPARAFDNGLFVVACNQTGDNGNGLVFPGNAVVFSPSGEILERRLTGDSGIIVVDLTAEQLNHVRGHRMRYFFPNRRPRLYSHMAMLNKLDE